MGGWLEGKRGKFKRVGRGQAKRMSCIFIKENVLYNIEKESDHGPGCASELN